MTAPLQLNATWLRNRVAELGLRQWWLAEQLGVDRRTVLRWVNGQVRSIAPDRAETLAAVLGCRVTEMLLHDTRQQLASPEDQRAAGLALATSRLLDRLGPVGEWDVIEQLVKASAVPDLPLDVLGRLYHQLCVACWRQSKLGEAQQHNDAALALAERCGDQSLRADALGSRANLQHWRGEVEAARASWREALALAPWLSARQRGALHNNLGASLHDEGRLAEARAELLQALDCFQIEGTPMNHSITHGQLALLALDEGDVEQAALQAALTESQARQGDYRRGLAFAALLQALVAARRGQAEAAQQALGRSLAAYAEMGIAEGLNHRLAARLWRWLGDQAAARAACDEAQRLSAGFPLERAAVAKERERVEAMSPPVTGQVAAGSLP
jgi:Tfp pilus assembly protein PilF/plasmid maintenance system antidote protein VapI